MRIDPITSTDTLINIYCSTDKGVRHFNINVENRIIEEVNVPD